MTEHEDAVRLEHRLTKLEEAVVANTVAVDRMAGHVQIQNGRIGIQERFRVQALTLIAALGFISPILFGVIFWWLNHQFN